MTAPRTGVIGWIARVLGILFAALMTYGWWDESQARQDDGGDWFEQWAIVTHLLPALVLIAAVVVGWWWPLAAAIIFIAYAAVTVFSYAPEWMYAWFVTVPPLVIGVLYLIAWWRSREAVRRHP